MRIILAIIFLICAADAFASEEFAVDEPISKPTKPKAQRTVRQKPAMAARFVVAAGIAGVGETANDNRNFEPRGLLFGRAGLELASQHELLLEIGGFKQTTGTSGVEIIRFHQQIDLWYHFLFMPRSSAGHPYLGAALGAQRDEVSTNFFGDEVKSVGAFEAQLSLAGGYRLNMGENLGLWLEGRLATSNNYEPRVLPSVAASIGILF